MCRMHSCLSAPATDEIRINLRMGARFVYRFQTIGTTAKTPSVAASEGATMACRTRPDSRPARSAVAACPGPAPAGSRSRLSRPCPSRPAAAPSRPRPCRCRDRRIRPIGAESRERPSCRAEGQALWRPATRPKGRFVRINGRRQASNRQVMAQGTPSRGQRHAQMEICGRGVDLALPGTPCSPRPLYIASIYTAVQ